MGGWDDHNEIARLYGNVKLINTQTHLCDLIGLIGFGKIKGEGEAHVRSCVLVITVCAWAASKRAFGFIIQPIRAACVVSSLEIEL